MASQQGKHEELNQRMKLRESVAPGVTAGKSLEEAQKHLSQGSRLVGQTSWEQLAGTEGYREMVRSEGPTGVDPTDLSLPEIAAREGRLHVKPSYSRLCFCSTL